MSGAEKLSPNTIELARSVDLVSLVGRRVKLTRRGRVFWGCCPFHKDGSPSFKVENERRAYHCFGCGAGGDAIAWVIATEGLSFVDAVLRLTGERPPTSTVPVAVVQFHPAKCGIYLREKNEARIDALKIWESASPAKGTVIEEYLSSRGIKPPPAYWNELRFAPRLRHAPSKRHFRAMVARISDDRGFCGIQRTFLSVDKPEKADVMPNKMTKGPMEGGAVRFRMPTETLGLAEGIETALSARQLYSMPVWAVLSCVRLKQIEIPKTVKFLNIFGDPDKAGKAEAFDAAEVYERKGFHTEVIFPGSDFQAREKDDFNSILKENAARKYE